MNGKIGTIRVSNTSDLTYESAVLITPNGVFPLGDLEPGDQTLRGLIAHRTVQNYAVSETTPPSARFDDNRFESYPYRNEFQNVTASEQELRTEARRVLEGLTLSTHHLGARQGDLTGLSRDLDAVAWLQAGGTILIAMAVDSEPLFSFDPSPSRYTSAVLVRIFQEAQR